MPGPLSPQRAQSARLSREKGEAGSRAQTAGPSRALSRAASLAVVEDLQSAAADLGWPEVTALADALIDRLCHVVVDLGAGLEQPTQHPAVAGAIGGPSRPLDHASCRSASAALRRTGHRLTLDPAASALAATAAQVALDLADLLDQTVDLERSGRLRISHKGVVLRRLHALARQLGPTDQAPFTR
ncbi:hypothetical protein [Ornithinimicrobium sp. Y1694]|uniref:hypothetical protein n=1 Tax=Ornithinimicrobium sp. Y1694 TaxID=3418590 RepID=UPI003CED64C1